MPLSPETFCLVVADAVVIAEGCTFSTVLARSGWPTGVGEQGTSAHGLPRNLGDPAASARQHHGVRGRRDPPWPSGGCAGTPMGAKTRHRPVSPSEGDRAR